MIWNEIYKKSSPGATNKVFYVFLFITLRIVQFWTTSEFM